MFPGTLLNMIWLCTKTSQTFSGTFSGTSLNLTWHLHWTPELFWAEDPISLCCWWKDWKNEWFTRLPHDIYPFTHWWLFTMVIINGYYLKMIYPLMIYSNIKIGKNWMLKTVKKIWIWWCEDYEVWVSGVLFDLLVEVGSFLEASTQCHGGNPMSSTDHKCIHLRMVKIPPIKNGED